MDIEHRPGRRHGNADGVSRIPCRQCGKNEETYSDQKVCQVGHDNSNDDIDVSRLKEAQEKDRDISLVKQWLESGERPSTQTVSSESWFVKCLLSQWSRLSVQQELLVRRWDELGIDQFKWQVVVPLSLRRDVLRYAHDVKTAAHLGIRKTLSKVRPRFYWPGLQNDVKVYVGGCEQCSRKKKSKSYKSGTHANCSKWLSNAENCFGYSWSIASNRTWKHVHPCYFRLFHEMDRKFRDAKYGSKNMCSNLGSRGYRKIRSSKRDSFRSRQAI